MNKMLRVALCVAGIAVLAAMNGGATAPSAWLTSQGFYIPPCGTTHSADGNLIHYELLIAPTDSGGLVSAFDAFKAQGYHNLQYKINLAADSGTFQADCSFGS